MSVYHEGTPGHALLRNTPGYFLCRKRHSPCHEEHEGLLVVKAFKCLLSCIFVNFAPSVVKKGFDNV